ncbi:MAG: prolipoprotein diacylglyceryl transferase [Paracoccaceae bacterium]
MQALIPFPDISPEIFSIPLGSVTLALRWYALAYVAGLLIAWRWIARLIKNPALWKDGRAPLSTQQVEDILTWVILGVILGGRLGFILFYQPAYYLSNPLEIPMIWQGGMSFHGGFLGVIVAGILYARKHRLSIASIGDCFAATIAVGLFFGRIANFINAELWGRPTHLPWGVVFPGTRAGTCPEGWVGPCSRHPSQLYEAGLEGLVIGIVIALVVYRRGWLQRPGMVTGLFLSLYAVSRLFVELFRQADAQFATPLNPWGHVLRFGVTADSFGLTMGQVLSLPMLAAGLLILFLARRNA